MEEVVSRFRKILRKQILKKEIDWLWQKQRCVSEQSNLVSRVMREAESILTREDWTNFSELNTELNQQGVQISEAIHRLGSELYQIRLDLGEIQPGRYGLIDGLDEID